MIPRSQRYVLAFLADEGVIISDDGRAVPMVARGLGCSVGHAGAMVRELVAAGLIERTYHPGHHRTYRIAITMEGREELGRGGFVSSVLPRRPASSTIAPAMPVCGPIGHLDFDPDAVREAQANAEGVRA